MSRCRFVAEENGPPCLELRGHDVDHRLSDGRTFPASDVGWRPPRLKIVDDAGHEVVAGEVAWLHRNGPVRDCELVVALLRLHWATHRPRAPGDMDTMKAGLSWESRARYLPTEVDAVSE